MSTLIFATANTHKFSEAAAIAKTLGIELLQFDLQLKELQSHDISAIVDHKAKEAYASLGRPLFVEHTSLHIAYASGLPGGFTRLFLERLGDDKVCELFGCLGRDSAEGRTTIGYCDGRRVHQFIGSIQGAIPTRPRGGSSAWEQFGWGRIFVPEGYALTLSEMGPEEKNKFSMRRAALAKLASHLSRK